jgi:hypothetical protein
MDIVRVQMREQMTGLSQSAATKSDDADVPPELLCPLCKRLLDVSHWVAAPSISFCRHSSAVLHCQEAVLLPCCAKAVCDSCARKAIEQSGGACGLCRAKCASDKLRPMEAVRRQVKEFLANKALAAKSAIGDVKSESDLALQRALEAAQAPNPGDGVLGDDADDLLTDVVTGQATETTKKALTPYEEYMQMFAAGKNDSDSDSDVDMPLPVTTSQASKPVVNPAASPDPESRPGVKSERTCVDIVGVDCHVCAQCKQQLLGFAFRFFFPFVTYSLLTLSLDGCALRSR